MQGAPHDTDDISFGNLRGGSSLLGPCIHATCVNPCGPRLAARRHDSVDSCGPAGLSSITEVDKIFTFSPAPAIDQGGVREWNPAQAVTATVNDNADTQGVAQFIFTCGAHLVQMKSRPFTIESKPAGQNPRVFTIRSDPAIKWIMQKPDGSGDVQVAP